jgi:hypothetical protein
LSVNEIRRLLAKLVTNTVHTISHTLAWSSWRRLLAHRGEVAVVVERQPGQLVGRHAPAVEFHHGLTARVAK